MDLDKKNCIPCSGKTKPLTEKEISFELKQINAWEALEGKEIFKKFKFKNFLESLEFVEKVSKIAEKEHHHPDIKFGWGYCEISLSTHAAKGLTENDFIVAAKIDKIS